MKNYLKSIYISASVILFIMTLITIFNFRQEAQNNRSYQVNPQNQDEPPTDVQDGVKSPRQREHGKRFNGYGSKRVRDLTEKGIGEITMELEVPLTTLERRFSFNRQKFIQDIECQADAVIIGTTRNKNSQLTESEDFIFTDYEIIVDQIFKHNSSLPPIGNGIVVTRIGGKIRYRGRIINAIDKSFRPFRVNEQYLLFLSYIPGTQSYQAYANGSFHLQNNRAEQLGGKFKVALENENAVQFVNNVVGVISSPCGNPAEINFRLQ